MRGRDGGGRGCHCGVVDNDPAAGRARGAAEASVEREVGQADGPRSGGGECVSDHSVDGRPGGGQRHGDGGVLGAVREAVAHQTVQAIRLERESNDVLVVVTVATPREALHCRGSGEMGAQVGARCGQGVEASRARCEPEGCSKPVTASRSAITARARASTRSPRPLCKRLQQACKRFQPACSQLATALYPV